MSLTTLRMVVYFPGHCGLSSHQNAGRHKDSHWITQFWNRWFGVESNWDLGKKLFKRYKRGWGRVRVYKPSRFHFPTFFCSTWSLNKIKSPFFLETAKKNPRSLNTVYSGYIESYWVLEKFFNCLHHLSAIPIYMRQPVEWLVSSRPKPADRCWLSNWQGANSCL